MFSAVSLLTRVSSRHSFRRDGSVALCLCISHSIFHFSVVSSHRKALAGRQKSHIKRSERKTKRKHKVKSSRLSQTLLSICYETKSERKVMRQSKESIRSRAACSKHCACRANFLSAGKCTKNTRALCGKVAVSSQQNTHTHKTNKAKSRAPSSDSSLLISMRNC